MTLNLAVVPSRALESIVRARPSATAQAARPVHLVRPARAATTAAFSLRASTIAIEAARRSTTATSRAENPAALGTGTITVTNSGFVELWWNTGPHGTIVQQLGAGNAGREPVRRPAGPEVGHFCRRRRGRHISLRSPGLDYPGRISRRLDATLAPRRQHRSPYPRISLEIAARFPAPANFIRASWAAAGRRPGGCSPTRPTATRAARRSIAARWALLPTPCSAQRPAASRSPPPAPWKPLPTISPSIPTAQSRFRRRGRGQSMCQTSQCRSPDRLTASGGLRSPAAPVIPVPRQH